MATALAGSSKEKTNYARLCRLLVDVGTQVVRDELDKFYPPGGLHTFLLTPGVHKELRSLLKTRILKSTQWGKLFPAVAATVSSSGFDITLLFVLLTNKNICGLSPPSKGWIALPAAGDVNREDDLARIKYYRNTIYAHASQTPISDADFESYWKDISGALLRLGGTTYKQSISDLKHVCMDPIFEVHYIEILKQWQMDEYSVKEKLDDIGKQLKEESGVKEKVAKISDQLKQDSDKLEEVSEVVKEIRDQLKQESGVKEKVAKISDQVKQDSEKLEEVSEVVKEIIGHVKTSAGQLKESEGFSVTECGKKLKELYGGSMSRVNLIPWNPEETIHIDEVYTRLQWVQREKTAKGSKNVALLDDYTEVFSKSSKHHDKPKRLLVVGEAGMGKSTFSSKVAVDWACGRKEELKGFELLIVLRLREVHSVTTLSEALQECLGFEQPDAERTIMYMKKNPNKVLLILDGLDEYNIEQNNEVMKILEGRMLPECVVLVTSRPWMGEKIGKHVQAQYRIMGFDWDDIKKYVARHLKSEDEVDSFLEYVMENNLHSLAEIPLLSLFLCLLWKERKDEGLPSNRTELYKQIVECIISHHNAKSKAQSDSTVEENTDILTQMGKIACNALKKNSLIFPYCELAVDECSEERILSLGLLSITKAPTAHRKKMVSFLHKSIQEFLAAWYIIDLLEKEEKDEVVDIMNDLQLQCPGYACYVQLWDSSSVVDFVCGLSDLGCIHVLSKVREIASQKFSEQLSWEFSQEPNEAVRYFHKCCLELCYTRSNEQVYDALWNCLGGSIAFRLEVKYRSRESIASEELLKFFYNLDDDKPWKICLSFRDSFSYESPVEAFSEFIKVLKKLGSFPFTTLLDELPSRDLILKMLWIQPNSDGALSVLQYDLQGKKTNQQVVLEVLKLYPHKFHGLSCHLDRNVFTQVPFDKLVRISTLHVTGDIGDSRMKMFGQQLQHMTQLRELNLSKTGMGCSSASVIGENLHHLQLLKELNLSDNPLGDGGVSIMIQNLRYTPHLEKLNLRGTSATMSGAAAESLALPSLPQLRYLNLSDNSLCDAAVQTLAGSLNNVPQLEALYLVRTKMTGEGLKSLAANLHHTTKLYGLDLSDNTCITDQEAWRKLAAELRQLTIEEALYVWLYGCDITEPIMRELMSVKRVHIRYNDTEES